ncbi:MAG: hypothetical protein IKP86_08615 [Anaerolineaceae bacterium]|nr:hypothetical protein [Anaerolineaceae bacterium]
MKNKRILTGLSVLFFLAAFAIVQYYIWGSAFITEYQADCTDTLFWAQSSLESGKLFKPEFDYAYRLAFGGQWLFMPFLKIFGVGMNALRCGMCLFSILFSIVLLFFFRSLYCPQPVTFIGSALMLLAMCAVKKTREIFFGHVIHYSLAVFYLLWAFVFLRSFLDADSRRKRIVSGGLFLLVLFMCSANGTVQMLFVTVPLMAGCLLELYLGRDRKVFGLIICIAAAAGAGFLFSRTLNTNYSDSYSVIVPSEDWSANLQLFPLRWISLFYALPEKNLDAFSGQWIKTVFKSVAALMMLFGMVLSVFHYKKLRHPEERIFLFTTWAMFGAFLLFFTLGKISDVSWRMLPMVFSAEVTILILFSRAVGDPAERTLSGFAVLLCGVVLAAHCLSNGLSVLRIPYDRKIWFAEDGLLETLKAHDLDYGYITNYWLSNSLTVLSDDTIRVRAVSWDGDHPYLYLFNSDLEWYKDQPGRDRWFLVLRGSQYDPDMPLAAEASEVYTCFQEDTKNMTSDNYVILVLDRNIMQEDYENLLPRYQ